MDETGLLEGVATDWVVVSDNGRTTVLRSPRFGANVSDYRHWRFKGDRWTVKDGRLVPPASIPASSGFSQADIDRARAEGRAEGLSAARAALAGVR